MHKSFAGHGVLTCRDELVGLAEESSLLWLTFPFRFICFWCLRTRFSSIFCFFCFFSSSDKMYSFFMPVTQTENHSQFINNGIESFLKKNIYEVLIFVAAALYQRDNFLSVACNHTNNLWISYQKILGIQRCILIKECSTRKYWDTKSQYVADHIIHTDTNYFFCSKIVVKDTNWNLKPLHFSI